MFLKNKNIISKTKRSKVTGYAALKYFSSWSKYTHVIKSIFTLCSHANSVHMSDLKGTALVVQQTRTEILMTAAMLFVHWSCT